MATKTTTPKAQLTAEEKIAARLGKFSNLAAPAAVDPYTVKRKQIEVEIKQVLADTISQFEGIFGSAFAEATDKEAVDKLLASIQRAQPSALKALRSVSNEHLDVLTTPVADEAETASFPA